MILACLPRGTVTIGTANLREEFLAFLEVLSGGVTGSRNSQSTMPDHEILVLCISHLSIEQFTGEIGVDIFFEVARMPLRMGTSGIDTIDVVCESCLNLWVLR